MNIVVEVLKAVLFGIVEGITEWLPVSSTGHMVLLNEIVRMNMSEQFISVFDVVIKLGAILAVIILLVRQIWLFKRSGKGKGTGSLSRMGAIRRWLPVIIAILPGTVIGILLNDWLEEHFRNNVMISIMLIVYGIFFIAIEYSTIVKRSPRVERLNEMDVRTAVSIGLFEVLAFIPGIDCSGATVLGGMLTGCSRVFSVEFSFIMAIPAVAGGSLIKLFRSGFLLSWEELLVLAVGCITAFIVSMLTICWFVEFIRKHSFEEFGWHRIILGLLIAILTVVKSI